jgi:hypothetical protein
MRRVLAGLLLLCLGAFAHGQDNEKPKAPPAADPLGGSSEQPTLVLNPPRPVACRPA